MQIFWTDNFNRETVSERIVARDIKNTREAEIMLAALRSTCGPDGPNWYKLVADDEKPYRFEP